MKKKVVTEPEESKIEEDSRNDDEIELAIAKITDYDEDKTQKIDIDLSDKKNRKSLNTLRSTYREHFNGEVLPDKYSAFANPRYISPDWGQTTCTVINDLEAIHWFDLSLSEQSALFDKYAQCAKKDPEEYTKKYSRYVIAIMYQPIWAYVHCFNIPSSQSDLRDDVVQETLVRLAVKTKIISKYKRQFAPSTFINAVAYTAIQQSYNENSGENKQAKIVSRRVNHVYEELKKGGLKPNEISTADIYQILEAKNAIPVSWQDIQRARRGEFLSITHDNCESQEAKNASYTPANLPEENFNEFDSYLVLKNALAGRADDITALKIFVNDYHSDMELLKANNKELAEQVDSICREVRNNPCAQMLRPSFNNRKNRKKSGANLTLGKERIPDAVVEDIAFGEIQDYIDDPDAISLSV